MCTSVLTSLRNSFSTYFGSHHNKPPRHPSNNKKNKSLGGSRSRLTTLRAPVATAHESINGVGSSSSLPGGGADSAGGGADGDSQLSPSYAGSTASGSIVSQHRQQIVVRSREIRLVRDGGNYNDSGYGFTLRQQSTSKNNNKDSSKGRPFIVTHIRQDSPADRDGAVQVGDRLISVNGRILSGCTLSQAQKWIRDTEKLTAVIEYDVALVDRSHYASSPLLVEVAVGKSSGGSASLGIQLSQTPIDTNLIHPSKNGRVPGGAIIIESIAPASIAERCGALQPGDQLLAIGEFRFDSGCDPASIQEAIRLLKATSGDVLQMVISPAGASSQNLLRSSRNRFLLSSPRPSNSGTLRSRAMSRTNTHKSNGGGSSSSVLDSRSLASSTSGRFRLGHPEWVSVTLQIDCRGSYGLALGRAGPAATSSSSGSLVAELPANGHYHHRKPEPIVINVESASPCDRAGCIHPGDRILRINGQSTAGMDLDEVVALMRDSKPRMTLDVEFDVVDFVIPASGVYWLKLAKLQGSTASYGLALQDDKTRKGSFIVVSVSTGSLAHRTGSVRPGDRLLAVHNLPDSWTLDSMGSEEEVTAAINAMPLVRLKLQKAVPLPVSDDPVVYTVELVRRGGPLGITISGTESSDDPIVISGLTEGGLAERTGALHAGDRLLAINGRSLQGKLLSEAIDILQDSGDVVTLKIGKSNRMAGALRRPGGASGELEREDYLALKLPALPSIDSAVESWVSSGSGSASSSNGSSNNNENSHHTKLNADSPVIYTAESATVRRRQGTGSPGSSTVDSGQFSGEVNVIVVNPPSSTPEGSTTRLTKDEGSSITGQQQQQQQQPVVRMSDLALVRQHSVNSSSSSTLPRHYRHNNNNKIQQHPSPIYCLSPVSQLPPNVEIHQVTLHKDSVYEDFGFSVSDGLYERGIYVNRIRKGGPADLSGSLRAFDRILQVNDTRTYDFDCCLTVPLIAAAGDTIGLLIGRHPLSTRVDLKEADGALEWPEEPREDEEDEPIPADAEDCAIANSFVGLRTVTTTL